MEELSELHLATFDSYLWGVAKDTSMNAVVLAALLEMSGFHSEINDNNIGGLAWWTTMF